MKNPETIWEDLCTYVAELIEEKKAPGAVIGLLYRGEIVTAGFGVTNVDHPLPVTEDTLFQIGSITKTYTGTLIMRLVEAGKLDLDAPVRTYLPDFKVADEAASAGATIRHLLIHTGGWVGDHFNDTGAGDDALVKYIDSMAELEQLAPLGQVWSYNNAGFSVAGAVIEAVTGESYEAVLKAWVLDPLGLEQSFFAPGEVMLHRFVAGHQVNDTETKVAHPWPLPRSAYPAGGITCRVKDLLEYARFHLGDGTTGEGERLLSPESLAAMQTPQVTVWKEEKWGLSWQIDDTYGTRMLSHGGGTMGQISSLTLVPAHDFALAIFTNANRGGSITNAVNRRAFKEYLDIELLDPKPVESSISELEPYVGRYARPFAEVELGILGGRLIAQMIYKKGFPNQNTPPPPPPPPAALDRCEEDRLVALDGPFKDATIDVVRQADGKIGWLRMGRLYKKI